MSHLISPHSASNPVNRPASDYAAYTHEAALSIEERMAQGPAPVAVSPVPEETEAQEEEEQEEKAEEVPDRTEAPGAKSDEEEDLKIDDDEEDGEVTGTKAWHGVAPCACVHVCQEAGGDNDDDDLELDD
jgi:catalase